MTRDAISARVRQIIADTLCLEPDEVSDDVRFVDLTDDFGRLEIIMGAEDFADVELSDDDAELIRTVRHLIDHLAERLGVAAAAA